MKNKKFVFLEHTADIKFRAFGKTLNEVFENSALATLSVIYSGKKKIKQAEIKKVKIKGNDLKSLLYNFLDEIIFYLMLKDLLLGNAKLRLMKRKMF